MRANIVSFLMFIQNQYWDEFHFKSLCNKYAAEGIKKLLKKFAAESGRRENKHCTFGIYWCKILFAYAISICLQYTFSNQYMSICNVHIKYFRFSTRFECILIAKSIDYWRILSLLFLRKFWLDEHFILYFFNGSVISINFMIIAFTLITAMKKH